MKEKSVPIFSKLTLLFACLWLTSILLFIFLVIWNGDRGTWVPVWGFKSDVVLLYNIIVGIGSFVLMVIFGLISNITRQKNIIIGNKPRSIFNINIPNSPVLLILLTLIIISPIYLHVLTKYRLYSTHQSQLSPTQKVIRVTPTPTPTPVAKTQINNQLKADPQPSQGGEWGKAEVNADGSYTMKVDMDDRMSTSPELFEALNNYRSVKGKSSLAWDDRLTGYAQERAQFICENGGDGHAGFYDFINNQGGYDKLGFNGLGENMARMKLTGVHLVEWIYSQSPGHEKNQLGPWSHMGVGISEYCSVVIFGGGKM